MPHVARSLVCVRSAAEDLRAAQIISQLTTQPMLTKESDTDQNLALQLWHNVPSPSSTVIGSSLDAQQLRSACFIWTSAVNNTNCCNTRYIANRRRQSWLHDGLLWPPGDGKRTQEIDTALLVVIGPVSLGDCAYANVFL